MWLVAVLADLKSSSWTDANFVESNPYWRDANGNLWLAHALSHCLFQSIELSFASIAAYIAGSCVNRKVASAMACLPWAYSAYGHFGAALGNYMIHLKMYVGITVG